MSLNRWRSVWPTSPMKSSSLNLRLNRTTMTVSKILSPLRSFRRVWIFTFCSVPSFRPGEAHRAAAAEERRPVQPDGTTRSPLTAFAGKRSLKSFLCLQMIEQKVNPRVLFDYSFFERLLTTFLERIGYRNARSDDLQPQASTETQVAVACEVKRMILKKWW